MSWYFTARLAHILQLGVLPQWKPMKVSEAVIGNLPAMSSS